MTKSDMVDELAGKLVTTKVDAEKTLDTVLDLISQTALAGEEVKLNGFGKFSQKVIKPKKLSEALGGGVSKGRTTVKFKSYL